MTTTRKPYNTYTKEFKLEALRLMAESDRPASEIAMKLGIRKKTRVREQLFLIYDKKKFGVRSFHATFSVFKQSQTIGDRPEWH